VNKFISKTVAACAFFTLLAPFARGADTPIEDPLVVEDLQCRGNAGTSCELILSYVYLEPGDRLDETEIRNAQLRLATLRMFDSVNIFLEKGSERGKAVVVIEIEEADPLVTEWLFGASYRLGAFRSITAGRLTNQNLFGAGKLADLSVSTIQPLNGPSEESYGATLRYADPHLLGSKRYFGIVSASYVDGEITTRYGNYGESTMLRFGAAFGRRLWDFSYLTVGYGYRARLDQRSGRWQHDGTFELDEDHNRHAIDVLYGWNSEDDIYFPTRGSSFQTGFGWNFGSNDPDNEFHLQFRKTWPLGGGFVSLRLGGDPSPEYRQTLSAGQFLTASYARPLVPGEFVRRGRWYVEAGYNDAGFEEGGRLIHEYGLRVGIRLETQTIGLIDLYVIGTQDPNR
jgi:outer membrane protein assembly factor BamA